MQEQLTTVLVAALIAIMPVLTGLLVALVKTAIARMKAGTAKDVALELLAAAETVVRDIEQRVRPAGKLAPEQQLDLKQVALAALKDQLSNLALKHIGANSENVDVALGRAIESAVVALKHRPVTRVINLGSADKVPSIIPPMEPPDAA